MTAWGHAAKRRVVFVPVEDEEERVLSDDIPEPRLQQSDSIREWIERENRKLDIQFTALHASVAALVLSAVFAGISILPV